LHLSDSNTAGSQARIDKIYADPTIVDPAERERVFAQHDHLRIYGQSFPRILESQGFEPIVVDETSFSADVVKRNVLFPPVLSSVGDQLQESLLRDEARLRRCRI